MPRLIIPEKQNNDFRISSINNDKSKEYKKICEEADKRIREYHKKLAASYIHAQNFVARKRTLKKKWFYASTIRRLYNWCWNRI